jgi:cytochrome c biogenesis protein
MIRRYNEETLIFIPAMKWEICMIENTKCECGHNNPVGTVLCEYCGKPLAEWIKNDIEREMRYEGKARRSQRSPLSGMDRVWNFFSSVKVAVLLIIITLIAAGMGTLLPQEKFIPSLTPETYYTEQYGIWGTIFYTLGFADLYSSRLFFLLISMIGISLVVCSLDRVIPLIVALKNQTVVKNIHFILRQRLSHQERIREENKEELLQRLDKQLKKRRYHVRHDGDALLAEKGRISRWGPYINHIGLILFLFGVLLRYVPGWVLDESLWIREGEIKRVPGTGYYLKNERAFAEVYDSKELPASKENRVVVKKYQTDAVLYEKEPATGKLKPLHRQAILVNHPLTYQGLSLFQSDFRPFEVDAITFQVLAKATGEEQGTFTVDLHEIHPRQNYRVGSDIKVRVLEYYPDFAMEENRPITRSQNPNQPAFIFEVKKEGQTAERVWVIAGQNLDDITPQNKYAVDLGQIHTVNSSGLMVRIDKSLPMILVGGVVTMIGLIMGFYWQHRRIWVRVVEGVFYLGAHTNKDWYSLRREVQQIADQTNLHHVPTGDAHPL